MSAAEIMAELSHLSKDELFSIATQIDRTLRDRGALLYDDAYGVFSEADQTALATQAWEENHGGTAPR
jgi:hypothetical protein